MNAVAPKLMARPLRVAVRAAKPARLALLSRLVREAGHVVVPEREGASVVLTEGVAPALGDRPVVALGSDSEGYAGRLPRDASPEQIDAALRAVAAGLSVTVAEGVSQGFGDWREEDERLLLTPRELEVLGAVSGGSTNKEIARTLGISQHTVKFHLESVLRKLKASSRAEAVFKATRLKLLEPYRL